MWRSARTSSSSTRRGSRPSSAAADTKSSEPKSSEPKSSEAKSGDMLAGIGARSETERVAAKMVLAELPLGRFLEEPLIDPAQDEVSNLILSRHDQGAFAGMRSTTVGELREWLLDDATDSAAISKARPGLTPEMISGVVRLMANKELVLVASKVRVVTRCRNTMGEAGVLGVRIQPNHPSDDIRGILASTIDGLLFGCGDAVIGVNPATDDADKVGQILRGLDRLVDGLRIPTQHCCLAHITTQLAALEQGAPIDLLFQSVAGTQAANASFGINLSLLREGREQVLDSRASRGVQWAGNQCTYFETGQGSALSAEAHHGVDQLTLEARAQAVAAAHNDPAAFEQLRAGSLDRAGRSDLGRVLAARRPASRGKRACRPRLLGIFMAENAKATESVSDKKKILLVDDDAILVTTMKAILEAAGHKVIGVHNGARALEELEAARYDLVIKGGEVIDPAQGVHGTLDVAFAGGRVAAIGLVISLMSVVLIAIAQRYSRWDTK